MADLRPKEMLFWYQLLLTLLDSSLCSFVSSSLAVFLYIGYRPLSFFYYLFYFGLSFLQNLTPALHRPSYASLFSQGFMRVSFFRFYISSIKLYFYIEYLSSYLISCILIGRWNIQTHLYK